MSLCVKQSRNLYNIEINRQKEAIEEGVVGLSPNIQVLITSKKSKSVIPPIAKKILSPIKKPSPLPDSDYYNPLLSIMLEANQNLEKSIKSFIIAYNTRNGEDSIRTWKNKDPVSKALRARNYEKFSAVNPWGNNSENFRLSTVKTLKSLHMQPDVLFDLENTYFDENCNLADRIKVIHSCLMIQNLYKEKRRRELEKKIIIIQKFIRGYLIRKRLIMKRTKTIRNMYYWERLKHWYLLIANKFRERKSKISGKDYSIFYMKIVLIQKAIRGYLTRKNIVFWKRIFYKIRQAKDYQNFYRIKQRNWKISLKYEDIMMSQNGFSSIENSFSSIYTNASYSYLNTINNYNSNKIKEEREARKILLLQAKTERIQLLG